MVVLGEVLAPYGVRGWLKIRPYTALPGALLDFTTWGLRRPDSEFWHEQKRLDGRLHGDTVLAQLDGVGTREEALALRGTQIGVARAALPRAATGEIYWIDLLGLAVVNRSGVHLGEVAAVDHFGAHPILRLRMAGSEETVSPAERLIPYVPAYVDAVDLVARRIDVDWQPDY